MDNVEQEIQKKIYMYKGKYGIDPNIIIINYDAYCKLEMHGNLNYECLKPITFKGIKVIKAMDNEELVMVGFVE